MFGKYAGSMDNVPLAVSVYKWGKKRHSSCGIICQTTPGFSLDFSRDTNILVKWDWQQHFQGEGFHRDCKSSDSVLVYVMMYAAGKITNKLQKLDWNLLNHLNFDSSAIPKTHLQVILCNASKNLDLHIMKKKHT